MQQEGHAVVSKEYTLTPEDEQILLDAGWELDIVHGWSLFEGGHFCLGDWDVEEFLDVQRGLRGVQEGDG